MIDIDRPGSSHPRLVLGAAQIGQRYGARNLSGRPSPETVRDILDTARKSGVRYVDTARAYGDSEADLGASAVPGLPPLVITKIAPLPRSGDDVQSVSDSWARSSVALGHKSGDVTDLLFHRVDDALRPGAWERARHIRDSAELSRIGVSAQNPEELLSALELPEMGHVQIPFNVLDRRWLKPVVVDALGARPDVTVVCRSVFLQGLLLSENGWPTGSEPAATLAALDRLAVVTESAGRAGLCVRFALSQPWVDAVVIGAETPAQVGENATLAVAGPLSSDHIADVLAGIPGGGPEVVDPSRWHR